MTESKNLDKRHAAEAALDAAGGRRKHLLARLGAVEIELKPLVREAVDSGVPLRRVSDRTGLSVTTVRLWAAGA